ncbi:hypothetical protein BGW80DRAFT_1297528 [Lactifluus volemus]|nr:hypothetical protein BGW80DRAFT_1297528 [Lactifluus volemus]
MELFNINQENPSSLRAFIASEAGKKFKVVFTNKLLDSPLALHLHIDGLDAVKKVAQPGQSGDIRGLYKTSVSVLPFQFRELELVDPDVENAPAVAEMGTIEFRAFRCQPMRVVEPMLHVGQGLHHGRISERSKKAGWHHVTTADEEILSGPMYGVISNYLDPINAPYLSIKIFYRPRELLRAQGIITGPDVNAQTGGRSEVNDQRRTMRDGSSAMGGPSRIPIKQEETESRTQRIRALQAELNALRAEESTSSVKREQRSPSPIVVGAAAGEVIDLTLDD